MSSGGPILHIEKPTEEHAFDNIPVRKRPNYADHQCRLCLGHGEWNDFIYQGGRVIIHVCEDCNGSGWVGKNGETARLDIVLIDGHPHWVELVKMPNEKLDVFPIHE